MGFNSGFKGLTGCYSFRLLYFVLFGDFNFAPYSMDETSYNIARLRYKIHPRTGHEGPEGEYSSTLSLTLALNRGGW